MLEVESARLTRSRKLIHAESEGPSHQASAHFNVGVESGKFPIGDVCAISFH